MRVGIGFTPFETRADVILRLAARADELGLESVGIAEGWTLDATVLMAEMALRTSRVGLGTRVLSVWGRTPATIALTAAGLQRCSGGRFSLGLGAGSPPLAEGFHGVRWERPLARVRETLTAVRALLRGERLPNPVAGSRPLRLGALPERPVPIALAALSPASIRLAGELADEWAPFLWARGRIDEGRALLADGESAAAERASTSVVPAVPAALGPDEDAARRLAGWWLSTYSMRMGPLYPRMLAERFGMSAAVTAVTEAEVGELPVAAEELAREVTLLGTYDEAGTAISSWLAAGADAVGLTLPPGRPEEELAEIVEVAGRLAPAPA